MAYNITAEIERKLKDVKFFIEATECEMHYLWTENNKKFDWHQDAAGFSVQVGTIKSGSSTLPVCVSFTFVKFNYIPIAFYRATSRGVDHEMIEKFITEKYPVKYDKGQRSAMTDAMNFHHCIHFSQGDKE